jgi:acyl carrier protein
MEVFMSAEWTRDFILRFIKQDLLIDRLDLGGSGVELSDIEEDTRLLGDGLSIDSVDALDLLVGIEKKFGLEFPDIGPAFVEASCKSVRTLADLVVDGLAKKAAAVA